jgi:hypothetical protein
LPPMPTRASCPIRSADRQLWSAACHILGVSEWRFT